MRPALSRPFCLTLCVKLCLLGLTSPVAANETTTETENRLEQVDVVSTAAGFTQKLTDAPASVTVVTRQELENKPYAGLADALRDIEGIDSGADLDKNGNISITMRGLPPEYTLILINGRRQSDIGNIGPNAFGNSQFMYMPPLDAIERIEVVRGPMSTLYGADAMGGVINIITRKVADEWSGSVSHSLTLQENSQFGDDRKTDFFVTGPLVQGLLGMSVRASLFEREESDPGYAGDRLPLPPEDINGIANPPFFEDSGNFGDRKIVAAQNWNAGISLNLTPVENHDFTLEYDVARQRYDNTQGQTGTLDSPESLWRQGSGGTAGIVAPRVGYSEYQRVERDQAVFAHTGRWSFGTTESSFTHSRSANLGRSLPLTVQEREALQTIWDQAKADQGIAGNGAPELTDDIRAELENTFLPRQRRELEIRNNIFDSKFHGEAGRHMFTLGGQYFHAEMEDGVFGMFGDGFRDGTVQKHEQWAVFAEDNWDIVDALTITLGTRYDHHNVFGSQVSPRGYLTFRANDNWTLKGGVSTGYKAPRPEQLFPGITGFGAQGVSPMVGSPDLQPETSINYELAAYFTNWDNFNGNITVFFNDFKDKIVNQDNAPNCFDSNGNQVLTENCVNIGPGWAELGYTQFRQATNVDKAETRGVEVAGRYHFTPALWLRMNYTYTDSEQKSGAERGLPLVNTPEHMANATLGWDATENLNLSLISEIRDRRFRGVADASGPQQTSQKLYYKGYEVLSAGARYNVNNQLTLHARVNNLLDKDMSGRTCTLNAEQNGYDCANDFNVTERGRSLWLSANMRF
ncbi:MAG: TonB-dependent receptor [Alcanivorax sp.]|nr:TonB-dependent receptor [Alcanivorax sp.]